jgi:hypothetical protein
MRNLLSVAALVATTACAGRGRGGLEAEWRGDELGRFTAPVTATLCAETGILEVQAFRADSGVALALFPADSSTLASGEYPVGHGASTDLPRPGALAGLRWFTGTELHAWESTGGTVVLESTADVLSGRFDIRLQGVSTSDTLRMTGRIRGAPVTRSSAGCGAIQRLNRP